MPASPKAIAESAFTIFGVCAKCYVLDDGRRIIGVDDFQALMDRMADTRATLDGDDLDGFSAWMNGRS